MIIDITKSGAEEYALVCKTARDVYGEELQVNLRSFPPTYIFMKEENEVVGSVGIWRGDEAEKMLAEKYCAIEDVDLGDIFCRLGVTSRSEIGEVCCLNAKKAYRKYVPVLFSMIHYYTHAIGIKVALLTQARSLRKIFNDLGMQIEILCYPQIERCHGVLDAPEEWAKVYFRLKPACSFIAVETSMRSHHETVRLNPTLLPPFTLGAKLSDLLKLGATD